MVYLMSAEEQIAQRIISSGSLGVKKTDLRKEFAEAEIDTILENMVTHGNVFIDKKGAAYYCWYKDHYFQSLLNSDPKFRLTYEAIKSLEQSFNRTSDGLAKTIESLATSIPNLSKLRIEENEPVGPRANSTGLQSHGNDLSWRNLPHGLPLWTMIQPCLRR